MNALMELDDLAKKQTSEENAAKAISQARSRLVIGQAIKPKHSGEDAKREAMASTCFFATLALKLEETPDWTIDTAITDGKRIRYNPGYIAGLKPDEVVGCFVHEVMHLANKHHVRQGHRDGEGWNVASDLAINDILIEAGFSLPDTSVRPGAGEYKKLAKGLSAEEYYILLPQKPKQPKNPNAGDGAGDGQGDPDGEPNTDPGRNGGVEKPGDGSEAARRQAESETDVNLRQAESIAKQRGKLPAGLQRLLEEVLAPKVDWKQVLREFISKQSRNDYAWNPPNRRFIHLGLYLPGLRSEELGDIVVFVDTSGSIGQKELAAFAGEIQGILEAYSVEITIAYHDTQVCKIEKWHSTDGPLKLDPAGGGGTSHEWLPDWISEHVPDATCCVCLTDCYTSYPEKAPSIPTLWACIGNPKAEVPFGQLIHVTEDKS